MITIIMLVAILTIGLFISTVNASVTIGASDSNRTVTITRNVNEVTNNVTNTFTYTIAFDSAYGAGANGGTASGFPTSTTVAFNNVAPLSGTATQTGTVDFAGTTFTKVGDYRFTLNETGSTSSTQYPLDNTTYYLYVSVRYAAGDTDGTQMVATVAGSGISDSSNDENHATDPGTKEAVVFESDSVFTNISITKTVTGNMGDKSHYFTVNVTIPGSGTYLVSGGQYGTPATSTTTVTAGTATALQIKHGETLTIGLASDGTTNQVPIGVSYTVAETTEQGYTTTIDTVEQSSTTKTSVQAAASNATAIVNRYEVATLTGVFLNIMPYVVMAIAVIILIALIRRSSKNKKEE